MNHVVGNQNRRNRSPITTRQREEELLHRRKLYTDRMEIIHLRALGIQQRQQSPFMHYDEHQQRQLQTIFKHNNSSSSSSSKKDKRLRSTNNVCSRKSEPKAISLNREDDAKMMDDSSVSLLLSRNSLDDRYHRDYSSIDKKYNKSPSIRSKKFMEPEVILANARRYSVDMKPSNDSGIASPNTKNKKSWGCCWLCTDNTNDGKDVQFGTKVSVVEIPNRFDYSTEQKYQMWPEPYEYHKVTERIKEEIRWEQERHCNEALDEEQYFEYNGKLIHPALVPSSSSSTTTTTDQQQQFPMKSIIVVQGLDDKSNPQAPSIESANEFGILDLIC